MNTGGERKTLDALRARVAKLEAALLVDGAKLLARNAKLEAALKHAQEYMRPNSLLKHGPPLREMLDAALKDAPQ